ncbi:hypothetical protein CBF17_022440 [Pantoea agglomerans]|jgi:hypothetical protein|nr:hypothetical protein BEE12_18025 [Pantoea agglomerans]PHP91566.1 hypothetical protein CBF17_022440 [Pantoea agglomerans]
MLYRNAGATIYRAEDGMRDNNHELLFHLLSKKHLNDEASTRYLIVGEIVCELMKADKNINRKTLCCKLLRQLEHCESMEEERAHYRIIRMLFGRS